MPSLDFLGKVDLLKGLEEAQLALILAGCHEEAYAGGDRLFREDDDADRIWIVEEGRVALSFDLPGRERSDENRVVSISSGESLGWSSFMSPYKYSLSAYCTSERCKVSWVEKEDLTRLFEQDHRLGYLMMSNLAAVVSRRFDQLQEWGGAPPHASVKVIVHLATCGIAAGAREVMTAMLEEAAKAGRGDILVETSGCIGKCPTEPNVTVEIQGAEPVLYGRMTPDRARQVFRLHVLGGEVQSAYVLK